MYNYVIRHPSIIIPDLLFRPLGAFGSFIRSVAHHVTDEWFSPFFQRGFVEVYGSYPKEISILNSAVNLNLLLSSTRRAQPYKNAKIEYENEYNKNPAFKEYFADCYQSDIETAINNATNYLKVFYKLYSSLTVGSNIQIEDRNLFLETVKDIDLSYPELASEKRMLTFKPT